METSEKITMVCSELEKFLLNKNKNYGDSVFNPVSVFSNLPQSGALMVRIDDKLSRIKNSNVLRKNDVVDLLGYLVLLSIKENWLKFDDMVD